MLAHSPSGEPPPSDASAIARYIVLLTEAGDADEMIAFSAQLADETSGADRLWMGIAEALYSASRSGWGKHCSVFGRKAR